MNRFQIIGLLLVAFCLQPAVQQAQGVADALRYSNFNYSGTARFMGTGGALGPLGADMSVALTNPAGIGLMRRSEFTITPALMINNTDSRLLNATNPGPTPDNRSNLNLHNLGAIVTSRPRSKKWKNINFAFTLNHLANFNQAFTFQGTSVGSIAESWQERANGTTGINAFDTGLAFDAGVLYDFNEDGIYDIDYELNREAPLMRMQEITEEGAMSELAFTLAGNYDEKISIGITLGVPIVNYSSERIYTEDDANDSQGGAVPFFESLQYEERLRTTGAGINAKLGLIFRLHQAFRLSAAVHTPTSFSLEDNFDARLVNNYYEDEDELGAFLGTDVRSEGFFDYRLRTPWRFMGGLGFVFNKRGFLTAEVEYLDFADASLNFDGFGGPESEANREIGNQLTDVIQVRLGGEFVLDEWRFRLGYNIRSAPFINDETNRNQLSAGFGYRAEGFFLDLGYRRTAFEEFYFPYVTEEAPIQEVINDFGFGQVALTIGAKF